MSLYATTFHPSTDAVKMRQMHGIRGFPGRLYLWMHKIPRRQASTSRKHQRRQCRDSEKTQDSFPLLTLPARETIEDFCLR